MLEPGVLDDWTHLLVHHHILQILQGGMLAYFILKWQHVLANCSYKGTAKQQSGKCYAEEENTAVLWLLKIQNYLKSNFIHIAALPFICFADKTKTNLYWPGVKQCDLFTYECEATFLHHVDSPSVSEQRDTSSHSTKPIEYMSILRKESRWKLMAPSSTSGAM